MPKRGSMHAPMLSIRALSHDYRSGSKRLPVLRIAEIAAARGTITVVRGPSGSGKTTLLSIVAGLLRPTSGTVTVCGVDLWRLSDAARDRHRARSIGYVMQEPRWVDSLTALENVMLPMLFAGVPRRLMRARAEELLARFGLAGRRSHAPAALSSGERARVALSRALSVGPAIVLLDEPTASLDEENAGLVVQALTKLAREDQRTVLVATHQAALVGADAEVVLAASPGGSKP